MASGKSVYLSNAVLDAIVGGGTWTHPATVYIALSTSAWSASATGAAMGEVSSSSTGYTRVAVTNNSTNFPNATSASKANGAVFTFPAATASWGTITAFYVVDAASAGNVLYGGDLTTSRAVGSGDTASFASGAMTFTEA